MWDALDGGVRAGPRATARLFGVLLFQLLLVPSAPGGIAIEGVEHKKVYADRVSFLVRSEAGFDYTVRLNDEPVATDTTIVVDQPEYYELSVRRHRQGSREEEGRWVQFIVRATDRKNSEWGLPRWTPYPTIASAAAEFAGATLEIVTPAQYPLGLEIPVVARVRDPSGSRLGVNGVVNRRRSPMKRGSTLCGHRRPSPSSRPRPGRPSPGTSPAPSRGRRTHESASLVCCGLPPAPR